MSKIEIPEQFRPENSALREGHLQEQWLSAAIVAGAIDLENTSITGNAAAQQAAQNYQEQEKDKRSKNGQLIELLHALEQRLEQLSYEIKELIKEREAVQTEKDAVYQDLEDIDDLLGQNYDRNAALNKLEKYGVELPDNASDEQIKTSLEKLRPELLDTAATLEDAYLALSTELEAKQSEHDDIQRGIQTGTLEEIERIQNKYGQTDLSTSDRSVSKQSGSFAENSKQAFEDVSTQVGLIQKI